MERGDRLQDLDEGAKQRQTGQELEQRRPRVSEGAEQGEGRRGDDVLHLVVGLARHFRRMRHDSHDERETGGNPEKNTGGAGRAPVRKPQSVTTSLPTALRSRSAAMASPARSSG